MGRNNKNIKYQIMKKLDSLDRIGTSKHEQQIENLKQGRGYKSDYIHSVRTMELYKDEGARFADWLKDNSYTFKHIEDIPRSVIGEYIQSRDNLSAWTSHLTLAAMNKIFTQDFTTRELGIKQRCIEDITNNRGYGTSRDKDLQRNEDAVNFIRACGFRRSSVSTVNYNNFIYDKDGKLSCVEVIEKGGKLNHYYILPEYRDYCTNYVENFYNTHTQNTPLFADFDSNRHINCHWFRNEYSCNLYLQLKNETDNGESYFNGSDYLHYINSSKVADNFKKHGDEYKGHDTMILSLVSQCLGHYRLDVCVNHYLRF